jgi:hypothetical protein
LCPVASPIRVVFEEVDQGGETLRRTSEMTSSRVLVPVLLTAALAGCCASRKLVVTKLDDAIADIAAQVQKAKCKGLVMDGADKVTTGEFLVQTGAELNLGAPTGFVVAVGGKATVQESTKVTVPIKVPECTAPPPAPAKLFLLDPDTGRVESFQ